MILGEMSPGEAGLANGHGATQCTRQRSGTPPVGGGRQFSGQLGVRLIHDGQPPGPNYVER